MKVEIPQILWNCEDASKGLPAALMSISLLPCGPPRLFCFATAGNCSDVNLWNIEFPNEDDVHNVNAHNRSGGIFMKDSNGATEKKSKIDFLCGLTRHEGPVNAVAFSPNGMHLATASDTGSIILWSPPPHHAKPASFWTSVNIQKEADLNVRVVSSTHRNSITDLSWSSDSKRFAVGTIDHSVLVFEDIHYNSNMSPKVIASTDVSNGTPVSSVASEWKMIYRNSSYHTHYIQGVSFDPLNVYIGTQSSDRTVRVWQRKEESTGKKKSGQSASVALLATTTNTVNNQLSPAQPNLVRTNSITADAGLPSPVNDSLTTNKFELLIKTKQIKYRTLEVTPEQHLPEDVSGTDENHHTDRNVNDVDMTTPKPAAASKSHSIPNGTKQYLFAAETTLESFVRRLSWTVDGAYLIVPAAVWSLEASPSVPNMVSAEMSSSIPPCTASNYATLIYQRHRYDEPWKVLAGLEKPSIAVRPNPVLFKLPQVPKVAHVSDEAKENFFSSASFGSSSLPYRNVFAVLTWDSVFIYDTFHDKPLSIARGLHYANIVDASWTSDGHTLMVCSTDGYISIIRFAPGELGEVYHKPGSLESTTRDERIAISNLGVPAQTLLPPCEPGSIAIEAPVRKKTRITPAPVDDSPVLRKNSDNVSVPNENGRDVNATNSLTTKNHKRTASEAVMAGAVDKLSLVESFPSVTTVSPSNTISDDLIHTPPPPQAKKQKKRIQPMIVLTEVPPS